MRLSKSLIAALFFLFLFAGTDDYYQQDTGSTGEDATPPEVSGATINGSAASVTFDEDLDNTAFANLINGDLVFTGTTTGASDLESCSELSGVVSCTADTTFVYGETVTLSSSGLTGDEICDGSSNCVSSISGESVTNNTPSGAATYILHCEFDADTNWGDGYTPGGNDYFGGTDTVPTITGATQSSAWSSSGTYSALFDAADERIFIDNTSSDYFNGAQGAYESAIYSTTATGSTGFMESYQTSANFLMLSTDGSNPPHIYVRWTGASTTVTYTTTATCTLSTKCQIQLLWDTNNSFNGSTAGLAIRVCSDGTCDAESWEYEDDADAVTTMSTMPSYVRFAGEADGGAGNDDAINVDDVSLWTDHTGANGPSWGF